MTQTNAQAALIAAATAMQGRRFADDVGSVTGLADKFKAWLDKQDTQAQRGRLIEYDLPKATGDGRYPKTLWTCYVRPRNNPKAPWEAAQVIAGSLDEATSLLTAHFPGYVWTRLEDTGAPQ